MRMKSILFAFSIVAVVTARPRLIPSSSVAGTNPTILPSSLTQIKYESSLASINDDVSSLRPDANFADSCPNQRTGTYALPLQEPRSLPQPRSAFPIPRVGGGGGSGSSSSSSSSGGKSSIIGSGSSSPAKGSTSSGSKGPSSPAKEVSTPMKPPINVPKPIKLGGDKSGTARSPKYHGIGAVSPQHPFDNRAAGDLVPVRTTLLVVLLVGLVGLIW